MPENRQKDIVQPPAVIIPQEVFAAHLLVTQLKFTTVLQDLQTRRLEIISSPSGEPADSKEIMTTYLEGISPWVCRTLGPQATLQTTRVNAAGQPISLLFATFNLLKDEIDIIELDADSKPKTSLSVSKKTSDEGYGNGDIEVLVTLHRREKQAPIQMFTTISDNTMR